MNKYLKRCCECRNSLERIFDNKIVNIGPFISALKYVLETRHKTVCTINIVEYGYIEFVLGVHKFKLQWLPKSTSVQLYCKHLEGDEFILTHYDPTNGDDQLHMLLWAIEDSVEIITPFSIGDL